jgi:hypothetical protein
LAAILIPNRHFETVKKLFFHELWLTKFLTKIKRGNAKMLDFRGVMTKKSILSAILKQSKFHLGSKLITVAKSLKLNWSKFELDQRSAKI